MRTTQPLKEISGNLKNDIMKQVVTSYIFLTFFISLTSFFLGLGFRATKRLDEALNQVELPTKPPYKAFIGGLPSETAERDIRHFFVDCKVCIRKNLI
jgi:hypothetical protein